MEGIKSFLQDNWYLSLVFLAVMLILLVVVFVLLAKLKAREKRVGLMEEEELHELQFEENDDFDGNFEVVELHEESVEVNHQRENLGYILTFDRKNNNWIIRKKGAERATRRANTKEEAIKIAKELSRKHNVSLTIKKKDGKFQKQR